MWTPLAGPCSVSCGQGEDPNAPEGQLILKKAFEVAYKKIHLHKNMTL